MLIKRICRLNIVLLTIKSYNGDERYHTRADGTAQRHYCSKLFIRLDLIDKCVKLVLTVQSRHKEGVSKAEIRKIAFLFSAHDLSFRLRAKFFRSRADGTAHLHYSFKLFIRLNFIDKCL